MGITIRDIAKFAGVSISTVSLVLSGRGYVSDATRAKVQKIIDEYNYRPLRSAQQLASNHTGNIGFIISDVHLSRSEAFYSRILLGAELEARNYDTYLLLSTVGADLEVPRHIPRFLKGRDVDGIIVAGSIHEDLIRYIRKVNLPQVLIDFSLSDLRVDSVFMDNRSGVYQAVEHLVNQGMKRIGFIGGSFYHPSIRERFQSYQASMDEFGLGDSARDKAFYYMIDDEATPEVGVAGTSSVLESVPDIQAIICVNDTIALGCLQELDKQNKRIPDEIAVIGFDDVNYAAVTHPPLSTVHVPKIEMGMEAVRLLMDRIKNSERLYQTRLIPVELVVRESSQKNSSP
ncbi:MAG: LacI family DNA-binding transcriptional regulator [Fidelibacterota bacterium]